MGEAAGKEQALLVESSLVALGNGQGVGGGDLRAFGTGHLDFAVCVQWERPIGFKQRAVNYALPALW